MSAPGMASVEVPVMRKVGPDGPKAGGELVEVNVWSDTCQGVDQGDAIATWLCAFLEMVSGELCEEVAVARKRVS